MVNVSFSTINAHKKTKGVTGCIFCHFINPIIHYYVHFLDRIATLYNPGVRIVNNKINGILSHRRFIFFQIIPVYPVLIVSANIKDKINTRTLIVLNTSGSFRLTITGEHYHFYTYELPNKYLIYDLSMCEEN